MPRSKSAPATSPPRRRKSSIEIYFVLYLSAIILLLGTTPSRQASREEELEELIRQLLVPDFQVKVEKAALLYSFIPAGVSLDTTGVQLRRDSVNMVVARGTFSSVDFKIVAIEDSINGESIPLDRAALIRRDDRSSTFQWRPSSSDHNAVYRVTVAGIATPLPPVGLKGSLRDKVDEVLRHGGTVRDSVTFTINVMAIHDVADLQRARPVPELPRDSTLIGGVINDTNRTTLLTQNNSFGDPYELVASNQVIPAPARSSWHNRISVSGKASVPDLTFQVSGGDAHITEQSTSYIEISGTTPASGEQMVTITGTHKVSRRPFSSTFTIRAVRMTEPFFPNTFYEDQSYRLDFRSSGIPEEQIAVEITEGEKVVVSKSQGSSTINYKPSSPGTVKFTRYLGDQIVDRFTKDILPIPLPVVLSQIAEGHESAIIKTDAYGTVRGQQNIAQLIVDEGNADDGALIDTKYDDVNKKTTQFWRVRRKGSGEFSFSYHAVDLRGSRTGKSKQWTYSDIR